VLVHHLTYIGGKHENLKNRSAKLLDVYWDKIANRKQYETPHL